MHTDALRAELKRLVYDEWRYPRVRPKYADSRWQRITQWEQGRRRGRIDTLSELLASNEWDGVYYSGDGSRDARNLIHALLDEARAEQGWSNAWPDWAQEEEEFSHRLDRGALALTQK